MHWTDNGVPHAPRYREANEPWTDETADRKGREYRIVWQADGDLSYVVSRDGIALAKLTTMREALRFVENVGQHETTEGEINA